VVAGILTRTAWWRLPPFTPVSTFGALHTFTSWFTRTGPNLLTGLCTYYVWIQPTQTKHWRFSALVSHSGTLVHIGQIFFPETWNDQVYQTSPYNSNTNPRTMNDQDMFLTEAFQNGYNAYPRCV